MAVVEPDRGVVPDENDTGDDCTPSYTNTQVAAEQSVEMVWTSSVPKMAEASVLNVPPIPLSR